MNRPEPVLEYASPAILRLSRLAPLREADLAALRTATRRIQTIRSRRELVAEGQEIIEPKLIVAGWAARVRQLADGRRQLLGMLLPGDLVGQCGQSRPVAVSTVIALTELTVCTAPDASNLPALAEAYAVSQAWAEASLLNHITRLGRLDARERISDFLLELHERLSLAGLVAHRGFDFPITQEMLADALGLTSVHLNRVLQVMRGQDELHWTRGRLTLTDPATLRLRVGRAPVRVSAAQPAAA